MISQNNCKLSKIDKYIFELLKKQTSLNKFHLKKYIERNEEKIEEVIKKEIEFERKIYEENKSTIESICNKTNISRTSFFNEENIIKDRLKKHAGNLIVDYENINVIRIEDFLLFLARIKATYNLVLKYNINDENIFLSLEELYDIFFKKYYHFMQNY